MSESSDAPAALTTREKLHQIIFGTETPAGKLFDVALIYTILLSVVVLMFDSVAEVSNQYRPWLIAMEWFFTIIFTVEYIVRLYCAPSRIGYAKSFYGVIDLCSVLPTYLALIFPGANYMLVIRLLRVLRVFRVLKLVRYLSEANVLLRSMLQARRKISIFFFVVLVLSSIFGSVMYMVEGPDNGFSSIPKSIYWTIVTITTVGYGDITPQTVVGQIVASLAMLTGYSIIAVPTGIVTAELTNEMQKEFMRGRAKRTCGACEQSGHEHDANFCKYCGETLKSGSVKN